MVIIPFIQNKIKEMRDLGEKIIFLTDSHELDDHEFTLFPQHCVIGTTGAEIIDELPVQTGDDIIIKKTRYSGFYGTDLENVLSKLSPEEVHVVGGAHPFM